MYMFILIAVNANLEAKVVTMLCVAFQLGHKKNTSGFFSNNTDLYGIKLCQLFLGRTIHNWLVAKLINKYIQSFDLNVRLSVFYPDILRRMGWRIIVVLFFIPCSWYDTRPTEFHQLHVMMIL